MEGTVAEIRMFGGNFAPRNWAYCDGQLLAISSNTALFSLLGTTFGGDGRTTFALPDMRGRTAVHPGTGPGLSTYRLGQRSGSETNILNITQMPAHNHQAALDVNAAVQVNNGDGEDPQPNGNFLARSTGGDSYIDNGGAGQSLAGVSATGSVTIGMTGANSPVNNMQPYLCVNYIICMFGVFPSRS